MKSFEEVLSEVQSEKVSTKATTKTTVTKSFDQVLAESKQPSLINSYSSLVEKAKRGSLSASELKNGIFEIRNVLNTNSKYYDSELVSWLHSGLNGLWEYHGELLKSENGSDVLDEFALAVAQGETKKATNVNASFEKLLGKQDPVLDILSKFDTSKVSKEGNPLEKLQFDNQQDKIHQKVAEKQNVNALKIREKYLDGSSVSGDPELFRKTLNETRANMGLPSMSEETFDFYNEAMKKTEPSKFDNDYIKVSKQENRRLYNTIISIASRKDFAEMSAKGAAMSADSLGDAGLREKHRLINSKSGDPTESIYATMSDTEKSVWNYLIGSGNIDEAIKYINTLKSSLTSRLAEEKVNKYDSEGVIGDVKKVGAVIGGGLEKGSLDIARAFTGTADALGISRKDPIATKMFEPTYAEQLSNIVLSDPNDKDSKLWTTILTALNSTAYQAPNFLLNAMGINAGFYLQSVGAATTEAIRGNTNSIADVVYGLYQGAMEHYTDKLLGGVSSQLAGGKTSSLTDALLNGLKKKVGNPKLLKALSMGIIATGTGVSEGVEELIQGIADPAARAVIYGEKMNYSADTLLEALDSAFVGFISGLMMGGVNANAQYSRTQSEHIGKTFIENDKVDTLVRFAEGFGAVDTPIYDSVKEAVVNKNEPEASEVGALYTEAMHRFNNFSVKDAVEFAKNTAKSGDVYNVADVMFNGDLKAAKVFVDKFSNINLSESDIATITIPETTERVNNIVSEAEREMNISARESVTSNAGRGLLGMANNIDGATLLGYNNNTNVNQNDDGGISNGEEAFDDRGYSQGDRQRSETNTGAESKERRIRTENEEDFVRRVTGASQKSPRKTRRLGKTLFAYTPSVADGSEASKAVGYLKRAGIDAIYCEGSTESNINGNTIEHNQATTSTDGKTFVSSNATLSAVQIAAHEAVHVKMYENAVEYTEYESVICDGLLWGTDEYAAVAKEIFEGYHRSKYEKEKDHALTDEEVDDIIRSPEYASDFLVEFTAYVNEVISANSTESIERFSKMFSDWNAVVEASKKFNKAIGLDFTDDGGNGGNSFGENGSFFDLSAADPEPDIMGDAIAKSSGVPNRTDDQRLLRKIGKVFGAKVKFDDLDYMKDGEIVSPEGEYDPDTNTITLNTNAKDYHRPVQFIIKHELTHSLEKAGILYQNFMAEVELSDEFQRYATTRINEETGERFKDVEEWYQYIIKRYADAGQPLGSVEENVSERTAAKMEAVADFVADVLFDGRSTSLENLLNSLQPQTRSKFVEWLRETIAKLKEIFVGRPELSEIEMLEKRFLEVADTVSKMNAEEARQQKTTTEKGGGVKNSLSDISVVDLTDDNELSKIVNGLRGTERHNAIQKYILSVLSEQPITLSDGKKAVVDKSDANHLSSRSGHQRVVYISQIKKIVENAVPIAYEQSSKVGKFDYFYYYEATVRYDGETFPMYLNVGRTRNDGMYHIYDISVKIRDTAHRLNDVGRPVGNALENGISTDSIPERVQPVNNNSMQSGKKYSMAGPRSHTANLENLEKAKERDQRLKGTKANSENTRRKYGWFRGLDRMWRYEISDKEAEVDLLNPEYKRLSEELNRLSAELGPPYDAATMDKMDEIVNAMTKVSRYRNVKVLGEILKHDKLYAAYPELRNYKVKFVELKDSSAEFDPATKTIKINKNTVKTVDIATIMHEVQHAIQDIEGFASGSSQEYWESIEKKHNEKLKEISDVFKEIEAKGGANLVNLAHRYLDISAKVFENDANSEQLQREREGIDAQAKLKGSYRLLQKLLMLDIETRVLEKKLEFFDSDYDRYYNTAGEIEARNVEERLRMTDEEREATRPDIDRKKVAFVEGKFRAADEGNIDEVAKEKGYSQKLYHQTGKDFNVFDTEHQKAGKYDPEMPTGTFLKPTDADIGLEGNKQMELYTKIKNPLQFKDRADAVRFWKRNVEGYAEAVRNIDGINTEYREKSFLAQEDVQSYLKEWRENNPTASRREIYKDSEYQRLADIEQDVLEEWENASNEASLEAKKLIDAYMRDSGYDGVEVENDQGSFGRTVKSYIVFDSSQMKSADAVTYDDNGNEIPLSARFDSSNDDIRYSLPERNQAAVDGRQLQGYNKNTNLNKKETAALLSYKSSESYKINAMLRDDEVLSASDREFVNNLDNALLKLPIYQGLVYRNISFDDFGGKEEFDAFIEEHNVGNIVSYKAFTSASTKRDGYVVEGNYIVGMAIESVNARDVDGYGNNFESEVIFLRDSDYIVDRITYNNKGQPIIYMTEVTENVKGNNGQFYSQERSETVQSLSKSQSRNGDLQGVSAENTARSFGIKQALQGVSTESRKIRYFLSEHPTPLQIGDAYKNGEITQEEYVDKINKLWEETGKAEGTIKPGEIVEPPNKSVPTPKSVSDGTQVRQFMRTVLESGYATPEMEAYLKELILEGDYSYVPTSNKKSIAKAERNIENQGYQNAVSNWQRSLSKSTVDADTVATGEALLKMAFDQHNAVDIVNLTADLAELGTRMGQAVQAFSLLKRMGGISQLVYLQRSVNKINEDLKQRFKGSKKDAPVVKMNEKFAERLAKAETEGEKEVIYGRIVKDIADQVPSTFLDKWNAWRYMAMLFNPTTHIRNVLGNGIFLPVVRMKDLIALGGEKIFVKAEDRTKVLKVKQEYQDFASKDFEKIKDMLTGTGKYNPSDNIRDEMAVFKNKILEGLRKFNFTALEKEDAIFLRKHYRHALGSFLQARNVDLKNMSNAQLLAAREYAFNEALKATYRDASKVANMLSQLSKTSKFANVLVEGVLPFKKTPINILKRGVEYSPIGIIKTLSKGIYDLTKGEFNAAQFIDGLAANAIGSIPFVIGMFLANMGIAKGGFDDEEEIDKLMGKQEYSIQIGDTSYTIDWLAPVSIPFFMGVAISEYEADKDGDFLSNLYDFGIKGFEPILNLSMLSGVNDMIDSVSYAEDAENLPQLIGSGISSYFSQALPTIFGKTANIFDDTKRARYVDKTSNVPEIVQKALDKIASKTPFASKSRAEYIDAWGELKYTGNFFQRFFQQFVSPGYASTVDQSAISEECLRLYRETGEKSVVPSTPAKYFTLKGNRRDLSKEEYYNFATFRGQMSADLVNEAINNAEYQKLTDEQKAEVITDIYDYVGALAKSQLSYSYEEIAAMEGGEAVLTPSKWNKLNDKAKQILVNDYFLDGTKGKVYKQAKNGKSVVDFYVKKVKSDSKK